MKVASESRDVDRRSLFERLVQSLTSALQPCSPKLESSACKIVYRTFEL
jgi:hypothetical protein